MIIVGVIVLTIVTGVGYYFLREWYKKKEATKPTGTTSKFSEMDDPKPSCPLGYRYDKQKQKCVPIISLFKF